jgi:hypothetical protein
MASTTKRFQFFPERFRDNFELPVAAHREVAGE